MVDLRRTSSRRFLGNALLQQGLTPGPVQDPLQGAAKIASALLGARALQTANTAQQENFQQALLAGQQPVGGGPTQPGDPIRNRDAFIQTLLENPDNAPSGRDLLIQGLNPQATDNSLFAPTLGVDNEGNPVFFQASRQRGSPPEILDIEPGKDTPEEASQRKVFERRQIANIDVDKSARTTRAKGAAKREQETIQSGVDAAKGIPTLRRSIGLLDSVRTGGFSNVALRAKQAFGVEGADEGELSANLGQAVLKDLKKTFGAQFTEREGAALREIRANFGKSAATNRRLLEQSLQIAEAAAQRAIDQANAQGDTATAEEIQSFLDFQFQFDEAPGLQDLSDDDLLNF